MNEDLEDFIIYLSSEKGLSQNTLQAYRRDISFFISFIKSNYSIQDWKKIQPQHIVDLLSYKKAKGYATSSISRHLIAIRMLFRFLKREDIISKNITKVLEAPKLWQTLPDVLTKDEMNSILIQPDTSTRLGARDKAILELLYASGLRVSELCQLNIQDVGDEYIRVKGKGGKERIIPVGKQAIKAIDHYLNYRNDPEDQPHLFLSKKGKSLYRFEVWDLIKYYAKKAGIYKNVFPHMFRHSFATHLLDNGADIRVIQEMMGHSNISSTDKYTHVSQSHIQKAFQNFHPRQESSLP